MTIDTTKTSARRWRISLLTTFPKLLLSDVSQGFPAKLEFGSRIADSHASIDDVAVRLTPASGEFPELAQLLMRDPAYILVDIWAETPAAAVDLAAPVIDLVVDDLSFQLQEPLSMYSMRVLDVSPPLQVGEKREFAQWTGYDQYKLSRSTPMGTTQTAAVPALRPNYAQLPRRVQDALDWYIKALHTPWDADRYIFLWICFEILRNSGDPRLKNRPDCAVATRSRSVQNAPSRRAKCGKPRRHTPSWRASGSTSS